MNTKPKPLNVNTSVIQNFSISLHISKHPTFLSKGICLFCSFNPMHSITIVMLCIFFFSYSMYFLETSLYFGMSLSTDVMVTKVERWTPMKHFFSVLVPSLCDKVIMRMWE